MAINRFDYSKVRVIRARAEVQRIRRGGPSVHPFVVGRFVLVGDRVTLAALESRAYVPGPLTVDARKFFRWRTRQGAWQWMCRHPEAGELRVWLLDSLDVAWPGFGGPGVFTNDKHAGLEEVTG